MVSSRIWGLCSYFNPTGSAKLYPNYKIFRENLKRQGLPVAVVELAFGERPFKLSTADAEILIQVRANSILWQKERLLNIGRERLPETCDQIVWLDGDIIFENENWVRDTTELLSRYHAVQPFAFGVRLPKGRKSIDTSSLPIGCGVGMRQPSDAKEKLFPSGVSQSHPGFAWAARRSVFDGIGLHDRLILGASDNVISDALCEYPAVDKWLPYAHQKALVKDIEDWYRIVRERVGDSITFTPGNVLHLYHGSDKNRRYWKREYILRKYDFDPQKDLRLNADGCWEWGSVKPKLHAAVARYFWIRNDDSRFLTECAIRILDLLSLPLIVPALWERREGIRRRIRR